MAGYNFERREAALRSTPLSLAGSLAITIGVIAFGLGVIVASLLL